MWKSAYLNQSAMGLEIAQKAAGPSNDLLSHAAKEWYTKYGKLLTNYTVQKKQDQIRSHHPGCFNLIAYWYFATESDNLIP